MNFLEIIADGSHRSGTDLGGREDELRRVKNHDVEGCLLLVGVRVPRALVSQCDQILKYVKNHDVEDCMWGTFMLLVGVRVPRALVTL